MKKNKITIVIIYLMVTSLSVFAQKDETIMEYWHGGKLDLKFRYNTNTLYAGSGSGSYGRVMSPGMGFGSASIFSNPAELGMIKKTNLYFSSKFKMGADVKDPMNDQIKSATDDFLKDTTTFKLPSTSYRKNTDVAQNDIANGGQLGTFSVAIPVLDNLTIGMGFNYPTDILLNLGGSGIRTKMKTSKLVGDSFVDIDILFNISMNNNFYFRMSELTFGAGGEVLNGEYGKLLGGFSVNRYQVSQLLSMDINFDGMMVVYGNQEFHFNNPNDENLDKSKGETNNFFYKAHNQASTNQTGFRFGFIYNTGELIPELSDFNLIFSYDYVPKFTLNDPNAYIETYQPKFFTGRVLGDKEDALDIIIDSLKITNPNLTTRTNNYFSDQTDFSFPSSLTIGLDAKLGEHTVAMNFVKYMGEYSYKFDKYKIGKNLSAGFKLGASFRMPDELDGWNWAYLPIRLLYLDIDGILLQLFQEETKYTKSYYRISGGVVFGTSIVEGIADKDQAKSMKDLLDMPIPSGFALSREYQILDHLNIGVLVFGFPDLALKFGVGVQL